MRHFKTFAVSVVTCVAIISVAAGVVNGGAGAMELKIAHSSKLGAYLATTGGKTLYYMTLESHGKIVCTGPCTKFWPPLLVKSPSERVSVQGGIKGVFTIISRPDYTWQLAYNAHPLYTFAGDKRAGQTAGQGVNRVWYVVQAGSAKSATPAPTATPASGRGYGSGY